MEVYQEDYKIVTLIQRNLNEERRSKKNNKFEKNKKSKQPPPHQDIKNKIFDEEGHINTLI